MTQGPQRGPQLQRGTAPQEQQPQPREATGSYIKHADMRQSGIVRSRARHSIMPRAVTLRPSRPSVRGFGAVIASAGDLLLVGGKLQPDAEATAAQPFATMFRLTSDGVVRERVLRGTPLHGGPSLATDGARVAVGQPSPEGGLGFVSVYRRRLRGEPSEQRAELELEATLELKPEDPASAGFGQVLALDHELLVVGQPASVSVYRHSAVGWLAAGTPRPGLPYEWNPRFGLSCAVTSGRVLVGNPVEIDGHRAGPGRVFVYRQEGDQMELEAELVGDGIEAGRESDARLGFGASILAAGEFVVITAPYELSASGAEQSRVYVYRAQSAGARSAGFVRVATLDVPSCYSVCLLGERLFVLGDSLHVFARIGNSFEALGSYPINGASGEQVSMSSCGPLLVLGYPEGHYESRDGADAGEVVLHFAEQL